jgi:hypothetical protein
VKYTKADLKKMKELQMSESCFVDKGRFEVFCETNDGNLQQLRNPKKMSKKDLAQVVEDVQSILFVSDGAVDTEGACAGADAVDMIYDVLRRHDLLPIDTNIPGPKETEDGEADED